MLDLGAGGWVILMASVLVTGIIVWRMLSLIGSGGTAAVGDGRNIESYGFDLTTTSIPRTQIVPAGIPKDMVHPLDFPPLWKPAQADSFSKEIRGKYLVSNDRVIGVVVGQAARAYPIRVMNWHEVVNDTLGGRPIAVTFSPLSEAVVAFDRHTGGEVVRFGNSGLLYNSNSLLYDDRVNDTEESLWCQLQARAVAGRAAAQGESLNVLPVAVVHWSFWRERYPETTVVAPEYSKMEEYRRDPYGSYSSSDLLRFPVDPLPPEDGPAGKEIYVIVGDRGANVAYPVARLVSQAGDRGVLEQASLRFHCRDHPPTVFVERRDGWPPENVRYAYWFAVNAIEPEVAARSRR